MLCVFVSQKSAVFFNCASKQRQTKKAPNFGKMHEKEKQKKKHIFIQVTLSKKYVKMIAQFSQVLLRGCFVFLKMIKVSSIYKVMGLSFQ